MGMDKFSTMSFEDMAKEEARNGAQEVEQSEIVDSATVVEPIGECDPTTIN